MINSFEDFPLDPSLQRAVRAVGYETPTPIQSQAIMPLLDGKDLLGIAQTGTGKTAAFALPILQRLLKSGKIRAPKCARALILLPTRELAIQVADCFEQYARYTSIASTCVFGGVSDVSQKKALLRGVDVLVATPGRLLDLIGQKVVSLKSLEFFVLDEADRMLDMGFIHDIRKIITLLPTVRQNLFFSATMPADITKLASSILRRDPIRIEVVPESTPIERIQQFVYKIDKKRKGALLRALLLAHPEMSKVLIFSRTKHGANRISETLEKAGITSAAIHGNKSQTRRQEALGNFKCEQIRVLVATDIAARGIDVDGVTHVFNFDLPEVPETYVHRIGRTARAGKDGIAIAFCAPEEEAELRAIEKLTRQKIQEGDQSILNELPLQKEASVKNFSNGERNNSRRKPFKNKKVKENKEKTSLEPIQKNNPVKTKGRNRPGSRARKRMRSSQVNPQD